MGQRGEHNMKKRGSKASGDSTLNRYKLDKSKKNTSADESSKNHSPKSQQDKLKLFQSIAHIHKKEKPLVESTEKRSTFKESVMKRLRPKKM